MNHLLALALSAEFQVNYIGLLELGLNQPTITTIFKLADALGIKPSKLINGFGREGN